MTVLAIDHVQLGMPAGGETAARAFYRDLLGLAEVVKPPELAGRGGVWFAAGGVAVHLGVDPTFRSADRAHPAFVVADLRALRIRLTGAGIEVVGDDSGMPVERCYAMDPFGNRLEFVAEADAGFSLR